MNAGQAVFCGIAGSVEAQRNVSDGSGLIEEITFTGKRFLETPL